MHLGFKPYHDHDLGLQVWRELGYVHLYNSPRFCGGCWSGKRSEMFEPNRELAIQYVRKCVEKRYHKHPHAPVICEQSLLAGLWRMTYKEDLLPDDRYPLSVPTPGMVLFHLSKARDHPSGKRAIDAYRDMLAGKTPNAGIGPSNSQSV